MSEKKTGIGKRLLYGVVACICVFAVMAVIDSSEGGSGGVMPLDESTMEEFNEANQDAAWQMSDKTSEMSSAEMASVAFRRAVEKVGYNPDKTILYWLSPKFEEDAKNAGQEDGLRMAILGGTLKQLALGDGSSKNEFEKLIAHWSPEVQEAARERRSKK